MIESDALGRGRAFIFVTLIGNEKIEISRILVLEVGRQGKASGTSWVCLPQWLPALFALLLFPVEGFVGYGNTVPVHQRGSASGADKSAILEARRMSLPVVAKFGLLTRK